MCMGICIDKLDDYIWLYKVYISLLLFIFTCLLETPGAYRCFCIRVIQVA